MLFNAVTGLIAGAVLVGAVSLYSKLKPG